MTVGSSERRFLSSRAGRGYVIYVAVCALLSAAVGFGFWFISLEWFKAHKSEEKLIALRLVDAFVGDYSNIRGQFGTNAPVPATFRAHAIEEFNKRSGSKDEFTLRWVGRQGREIATGPSDGRMARTIESFAGKSNAAPFSELLTVDGQVAFRTIYPSYAHQQSCVDCHNQLQPNANWQLNDLMGAFAIDVPAGQFLSVLRAQAGGLALALFLALAFIGYLIARQQFHQLADREAAHAELGRVRSFLDAVIEHMPAILTVKDIRTHHYVLVNRAAGKLFKLGRDFMLNKSVHDVFGKEQADRFHQTDREAIDMRGKVLTYEHTVAQPDKTSRMVNTTKLAVAGEDGEPQYLIALSEDITERKLAEAQIAHMAHHDGLTDLPNRVAFSEHLKNLTARASESGESFAVLCLDLDRFKEINDVFGHSVGDGLLREVARRFEAVADGAFLTRFGGDEFTLTTPLGRQPEVALALADRLHASLLGEIDVAGHRLRTALSVGVAIYPKDGGDETSLLSHADAALYRAKADGRGKTQLFDIAIDQQLRERRELQIELRASIAKNELHLHYQPLAKADGTVIGLEALCRWRNPTRGAIGPDIFIPLAEETGLIIPIGEWVLRDACREAASWPKQLRLAVNLSPVQFRHGDLVGLVHEVLLDTGLAPDRLELEVTEGVLVDDFPGGVSILRRLKALGVRISMDDFGTGYSSLSYLQAFPFDKIKIDRSFIANIETRAQSAAIVRGVIRLAQELRLPVLAEGVENPGQLAFLAREQCDEVQGFLLGRPAPIEVHAELVGRQPLAMLERSLA